MVNGDCLSIIRIKILGKFTTAVLDSGAAVSAMNLKMVRSLGLVIVPPEADSPKRLYAANGQSMRNRGMVITDVDINGINFRQKFLVLEGLTANVICGCDFLSTHKVVVDLGRGIATLSENLSIPLIRKKEYLGLARLMCKVIIPPKSNQTVAVGVRGSGYNGMVHILDLPEPVHGMKVATKTCKADNVMSVQLCNETDKPLYLRRYGPVACCLRVLSTNDNLVTNVPNYEERKRKETPQEKKVRVMRTPPSDRTIDDLELSINKDGYIKTDTTRFRNLIQENIDLFAVSNAELPGCTLMRATFKLKDPNAKPVRGRVFSHSKEAKAEIERQVTELLKDDFIERSCSPFSSSVMLVKKSDGSLRMVQDNRPINKLLEEEIFVPNTLAEIVERVGAENPTIFSSVDLRNAYQQIILEEGPSRDYCAFVCHLGTYSPKRLTFGLQAAPAKFMLLMSMVIGSDPMLQRNCIPYLDDLLLFSKNLEDHTELLRRLFNALRKAGLRIHPGKCEFLQQSVKYVGHIFSDKGIAPDPKKLSAILEFPRPTTKRKLKGFLGMNSFYRAYHKDLSKKIVPLLKLLKKDQKFIWTRECEDAFQDVRKGLRSMESLAFPDESPGAGKYIIQVDASQTAIAGTLSQASRDGSEERLLACYGRNLRQNEINWPTSDKEGAALMLALLRWKHLLLGNPGLEIRSDNMSVTFLERIKHATSPRLARWSTAMSPLLTKATWTHVPGTKNVVPDTLSRQDYPPEDLIDGEEDLLYDDMTFAAIQDWNEDEISGKEEEIVQSESTTELEKLLSYCKISNENLDDENPEEWKLIEEAFNSEGNVEEAVLWIYHGQSTSEVLNDERMDESISAIRDQIDQKIREIRSKCGQDEVTEYDNIRDTQSEINVINATDNCSDEPVTEQESKVTKEEAKRQIGIEICSGSAADLRQLQKGCPELGPLFRYVESRDIGDAGLKETRRILNQAEWHFLDENGILCSTSPRMSTRPSMADQCYKVVPVSLRQEIMSGFHQFGHCGIARLLESILKAGYKWERIYADIRNFVLSCKACSIAKRGIITPRAPLKPLPIPERPGEVLQIDICGPYTPSRKGHIAVLSVVDRLTSYTWLYALKACTSEIIANKLFKVFADIGIPRIIISDNASNLVSKVMQEMAQRLGIKRVNVAPYRSQSNGKVERTHRTIQDSLRALLTDAEHTDWNTKITEILWGLRSAVSPVTKKSPFELRNGMQMTLPVERSVNPPSESTIQDLSEKELTEYGRQLEERIKLMHKAHKEKLEEMQETMKENYDRAILKTHKYQLGEEVYLKVPAAAPGISRKLQSEYFADTFEIVEVQGDHNVRLRNRSTKKDLDQVVHVDRLKPVVQRDIPKTIVAPESLQETGPKTRIETPTSNGLQNNEDRNEPARFEDRHACMPIRQQRIVQQKGSGSNRKFRIQWKDSQGRLNSYWSDIADIPTEILEQWQKTHGLSGKTLREYRRQRSY